MSQGYTFDYNDCEYSSCELLARILMSHESLVRRMIRGRLDPKLSRRIDVDDVVQEAMVNAISRISTTTQPSIAWLLKIIANTITDLHRRHSSQKRAIQRVESRLPWNAEIAERIVCHANAAPVRSVMTAESRIQVREAIGRLRAQDREVLQLRYGRGLSNQQTAKMLRLGVKAASIRHRRALDRLRKSLEAEFGQDVRWCED